MGAKEKNTCFRFSMANIFQTHAAFPVFLASESIANPENPKGPDTRHECSIINVSGVAPDPEESLATPEMKPQRTLPKHPARNQHKPIRNENILA